MTHNSASGAVRGLVYLSQDEALVQNSVINNLVLTNNTIATSESVPTGALALSNLAGLTLCDPKIFDNQKLINDEQDAGFYGISLEDASVTIKAINGAQIFDEIVGVNSAAVNLGGSGSILLANKVSGVTGQIAKLLEELEGLRPTALVLMTTEHL